MVKATMHKILLRKKFLYYPYLLKDIFISITYYWNERNQTINTMVFTNL